MLSPDPLKAYAKLVGEQLRWKKARPIVEEEIEAHLTDQRDALLRSGMGEEKAIEESPRWMGDAVEIGARLDRIHHPKPA